MHRTFAPVSLITVSLCLALVACGTAKPDFDDPKSIPVGGDTSGVDPTADTDKDGIYDVDEGAEDNNMNGTPAHLDAEEQTFRDPLKDTDGDGTADGIEGAKDSNGDGVPAYRDPTEGGTGKPSDGGMEGGPGEGGKAVPFGQPCTAADSCGSAAGLPGCCASNMICGAMAGGTCQGGQICGGSLFCGGAGACCTSQGQCGTLGSDGVTCAGGGVTTDGGTEGGPSPTSCPMVGTAKGCCYEATGKCSALLDIPLLGGCLAPDDALIDPPITELIDCTP